MEKKQFTVADLIEKLQAVEDKTKVVCCEGCDCTGDWNGDLEEYKMFDKNYLELKTQ